MSEPDPNAAGIDLGTCFSSCQNGDAVPIIYGNRIVPSVVEIQSGVWGLAGRETRPTDCTIDLAMNKFLIGRYDDDGMLAEHIKLVPHAKLDGGRPFYEIEGLRIYPEEVAGYLLGRIKLVLADTQLTKLVIATPAYFTTQQRNATLDAAYIGGFDRHIIHTIEEPVAALIDFVWRHPRPQQFHEKIFVVKDVGGGTTDVSAVRFTLVDDRYTINILGTAGDNCLGGEHFTRALHDLVLEKASLSPLSIAENAELLQACNRAKQELSAIPTARIDLPTPDKTKKSSVSVTRAEFEKACTHLLGRIENVVDDLQQWREDASNPDIVLLVGGSCLMPAVQSMARRKFPKGKVEVVRAPEEAIARGAYLSAQMSNIVVTQVLPRGLSVEAFKKGKLVPDSLAPRNVPLPKLINHHLETNYDGQEEIEFKFYEGDSKTTTENILMGSFVLSLRPEDTGSKGKDIRLDGKIEEPGCVSVTATVGGSEKPYKMKAEPRVPPEELEEMRRKTMKRLSGEDPSITPVESPQAAGESTHSVESVQSPVALDEAEDGGAPGADCPLDKNEPVTKASNDLTNGTNERDGEDGTSSSTNGDIQNHSAAEGDARDVNDDSEGQHAREDSPLHDTAADRQQNLQRATGKRKRGGPTKRGARRRRQAQA